MRLSLNFSRISSKLSSNFSRAASLAAASTSRLTLLTSILAAESLISLRTESLIVSYSLFTAVCTSERISFLSADMVSLVAFSTALLDSILTAFSIALLTISSGISISMLSARSSMLLSSLSLILESLVCVPTAYPTPIRPTTQPHTPNRKSPLIKFLLIKFLLNICQTKIKRKRDTWYLPSHNSVCKFREIKNIKEKTPCFRRLSYVTVR